MSRHDFTKDPWSYLLLTVKEWPLSSGLERQDPKQLIWEAWNPHGDEYELVRRSGMIADNYSLVCSAETCIKQQSAGARTVTLT